MNMRHYILRVLLVFACLFVLFSHSLIVCAVADEVSTFYGIEYPIIAENPNIMTFSTYEVSGYKVRTNYYDINGDYIFIDNGELDLTDIEVYENNDGRVHLCYQITFPESISRGDVVDVSFKISYSLGSFEFRRLAVQNSNSNNISASYNYVLDRANSTAINFRLEDLTSSSSSFNKIFIFFYYTPTAETTTFSTTVDQITVTEVSSNGLLSNIIEFLKTIWDGIKNLPSNIANSIKGFFDNVVNAVTNLGNFIIDGIKGLFIPSEEDITNMKDKWETLLSDRFGALYQVVDLIADYASSFKEQNKKTITFPSVSIPLAGATFNFGGWEVQVVPDGFGIIFDTLKMITSILATMLFINGLKNRFDKIMGGADDI